MALITSQTGKDSDAKQPTPISRTVDDGPPPALDRPRKAEPKGSLFQQSTNSLGAANAAGLGPEGGDPAVMEQQFMSQILGGIKGLSALKPEVVPVLGEVIQRLLITLPQMANMMMTNPQMGLVPPGGVPRQPGMGGGLVPGMGGVGAMPLMGPQGPGMPPTGMPPPGMQPPPPMM